MVLAALLAATACTSRDRGTFRHVSATTAPVSSAPVPGAAAYLSFREGTIDSAHRHGREDVRVYPDGRLAVQTMGSGTVGCVPRPARVAAAGSHAVVVEFGEITSTACTADEQVFTSTVRLPSEVAPQPPLRVTVRFPRWLFVHGCRTKLSDLLTAPARGD